MERELLTPEEAAEYFTVKPSTFRSWINRGDIPPDIIKKIGGTVRIKKSKLKEFIQK